MSKPVISYRSESGCASLVEFSHDDGLLAKVPVVLGFPSATLTGILACGTLVEALSLKPIGVISSHKLSPVAVIENGGAPMHPIRIYGGPQLIVVTSETKLEGNDLIKDVASCILELAERRGSEVFSVEGMPSESADPVADQSIKFVSTSPVSKAALEAEGHQPILNGVIGGLTGALLAEGSLRPIHVNALVAPTTPQRYKDTFSALNAATALSSLCGLVDQVDLSPLMEKGKLLEQKADVFLKSEANKERLGSNAMYACGC